MYQDFTIRMGRTQWNSQKRKTLRQPNILFSIMVAQNNVSHFLCLYNMVRYNGLQFHNMHVLMVPDQTMFNH